MKPFEKHDWYGFSGAEVEQGKPPLIGYTNKFVIVVDIHGIGVYPADMDRCFGLELPYMISKIVAEKLETTNGLTETDLIEMGFIKY